MVSIIFIKYHTSQYQSFWYNLYLSINDSKTGDYGCSTCSYFAFITKQQVYKLSSEKWCHEVANYSKRNKHTTTEDGCPETTAFCFVTPVKGKKKKDYFVMSK